MDKKTIKLKYIDQDSTVTSQDKGPFYDILSKLYNIEFSDEPDYVIYSPFGDEHLKYFNAVKIFYTGECVSPDFNECDYAIGFDYIDFSDRYLRYPLWLRRDDELNKMMESKHLNVTDTMAEREFCSFVVSNSDADVFRDKLFETLLGYKSVDSGGRYRNNIGMPNGVEDKLVFQSKHKFSIACENASYPGYTTEKIMEAFAAGTVPIYWGDPLVAECFNEKSFINCHNFSSINEIVKEVIRIDNDDDAYINMLKTPALIDTNDGYLGQREIIIDFFKNIFDQDKDKAYRRNLVCWGEKYNYSLLERKNVFDKKKGFKQKIKRILGIEK